MEVSGRRRPTLSQHMSMVEASTLRDGRNTLAGLTLAAVLGGDSLHPRRQSTTRTLLDIIKEEQSSSATVYGGLVHHHHRNKKSWKSFKDRLRSLRDCAASSSSSTTITQPLSGAVAFSAVAHQIHQISRCSPPTTTTRTTTGDPIPVVMPPENPSEINARAPVVAEFRPEPVVVMRLSAALEAEREEQRQQGQTSPGAAAAREEEGTGNAGAAPTAAVDGPRVSLMSLLEETEGDREQAKVVAVRPTKEEEDGKGEDDVAEGGREGGGEGQECVCCVCMVRHKGAAFILCGHTFCRLCSRELWVSRGNCPLCNGYILEILDIF